jgi:glucan phosphoethanolaminetransferase (alkaline phosphatase superfamily)
MNRRNKYLLSAVLVIAALLSILVTWSPLLFTLPDYTSRPLHNGYEVPMGVVGVSYPLFSLYILAAAFIAGMLILFFLARKRKAALARFWINGISSALILAHAVMWLELFLVTKLLD